VRYSIEPRYATAIHVLKNTQPNLDWQCVQRFRSTSNIDKARDHIRHRCFARDFVALKSIDNFGLYFLCDFT
jgi:hypothetical protein